MATILLVGSDRGERQTARSVLERAGHAVVEATTGLFLRITGERPVDAVVMELSPPQEIVLLVGLMELRRQRPALPIITLCDGPKAKDLVALAAQAGADGALRRPFTPDQLERAVALCLTEPDGPSARRRYG